MLAISVNCVVPAVMTCLDIYISGAPATLGIVICNFSVVIMIIIQVDCVRVTVVIRVSLVGSFTNIRNPSISFLKLLYIFLRFFLWMF